MSLPPVTIVMTTYFPEGEDGYKRRAAAVSTMLTWDSWLLYHGDLFLHIADDGSTLDYHIGHLGTWEALRYNQQGRRGVGASLNTGFRYAFQFSPLTLYAVDDWSLIEPFDITPWVELLLEREDIGMVRLGPPHPNTRGTVEAFTGNWQSWGLRLDRYAFAFGHRPALYHKRFLDYYGWFDEDLNALECERLYAERFCADPGGPDIVLALPHPWQHIESVELAYLDPRNPA